MGIRPRKSGSYLPPVPDDSTSRWGSWVDDLDSAGGTAGEGFEEIDAKASSGNAGVSELATRVAGLEYRVEELETRVSDLEPLVGRVAAMESTSTASGTGWIAHKRNGIVTLHINGSNGEFTLPVDFSPITRITTAIGAGAEDHTARVRITSEGQVSFLGNYTYPIYGHVTFMSI